MTWGIAFHSTEQKYVAIWDCFMHLFIYPIDIKSDYYVWHSGTYHKYTCHETSITPKRVYVIMGKTDKKINNLSTI